MAIAGGACFAAMPSTVLAESLLTALLLSCKGGAPIEVVFSGQAVIRYSLFWGAWAVALRAAIDWIARRHAIEPGQALSVRRMIGRWAVIAVLTAAGVFTILTFVVVPWLLDIEKCGQY